MDRVFNIGSPMYEVLKYFSEKIDQSNIVTELGLSRNNYFILSAHREENVDGRDKLKELFSSLMAIRERYAMPIVFSIHPRTEARLMQFGLKLDEGIIKCKPFSFTNYISLQRNAFCVLSDSGTVTEESSIIGFPAINIRDTHERLEGMEKAVAVMTGFNKERILNALKLCERKNAKIQRSPNRVDDYFEDHISDKIVKIILSYTDYVNKKVWYK
jgi:UDP-N-acetylglucosamine 2-epimerase (non-hydrolysing)